VRDLQRCFLERNGFEVTFADDGVAALELARTTAPTAVVTEILLPKLDGLTLCRQLRDDPATERIPVVVFSILAAETRAAEAGAAAFLRKPIVEATFIAALQRVIPAASTAPSTVPQEIQWQSR
jgi:CheY-like chemotaxis protein